MKETATESRPRVCVLTGSFHPVVGGGERHARLLCRELAARGLLVHVLTRRRTPESARREEMDGFTVVRVGPSGFSRLGKYLMLPAACFQLWRLRKKYDVVYVAGLRVLGWAGMLAQACLGKPCVLRAEARGEFSGEFIWKTPEGVIRLAPYLFFRPLIAIRNMLFRRAACFLAISAPIREEFQMGGVSPARIVDLPNGYDPALFHPLPAGAPSMAERRIALGLPPEGLVFAYSGKLNRGKGLERLITIWGRFAAEHPTARLLLIGSGKGQYLSCEEELKKQAQAERVDASILFTGYVEDVAAYLHVADAFVFPSESEAQGLSVLEAMACGVPVLASDIPGIADMVRDGVTGRLVPPQAVEAWLAALQEFVEQRPRFAAMAESAVAHAEAAYAIAAIAGKHAELFCQLLSPSVVSPR